MKRRSTLSSTICCKLTRRTDKEMLLESPVKFVGGNCFLNMIADKYHDGRAAALQQWLLDNDLSGQSKGVFWGFITYNPEVKPVELPKPQTLMLFPDNGLANYRDPVDDVTLSVVCGPFAGYNAYRKAQGPCDRMSMAPGAGHFTLSSATSSGSPARTRATACARRAELHADRRKWAG